VPFKLKYSFAYQERKEQRAEETTNESFPRFIRGQLNQLGFTE